MKKNELCCVLCSNYAFVRKSVRVSGVHENDVDDVCGEIMAAAAGSIRMLKQESSIRSWLSTIIRRKVGEYYRKQPDLREISNMIRTEDGREIDLYDFTADEATVESILQEAERVNVVDVLIGSLSEISQCVIRMHFWAGYELTDIANVLGVNVNTVSSLYRRGLEKLRENSEALLDKERDCG